MTKEILLIDHDDCLSDFMPSLLSWYNWDADDNLKVENISDWNLSKFVKRGYEERIYEYLEEPNISRRIFMDAKPQPHSIEVTKWLQQIFDIKIVSATHPYNVKTKVEWIERYYPHISILNDYYVMPEKHYFNAKRIIDDKFTTAAGFEQGLLMTKPWNINCNFPKERRVNDWFDIRDYFQRLINLGIIRKEVA